MEDKYFKQALSDFTIEFAAGDAIRSLSDKGYSVKKIKSKLDFPTPEERIREIVWKHYLENKTVCMQDPKEASLGGKYTIEKVYDNYGRPSFKQVRVDADEEVPSFKQAGGKADEETKDYVECDFGKRLYKNKDDFIKSLSVLDEEEKDYILGLPWPLTNVWHVKNEHFERIMNKLSGGAGNDR